MNTDQVQCQKTSLKGGNYRANQEQISIHRQPMKNPAQFLRKLILAVTLMVCGLRASGYAAGGVTAWGYYYDLNFPETYRLMYVPGDLTNVLAIAGGQKHALAIKSDGKVVAWGDGTNGKTNVPPSATNVIAIAAGRDHSLALKSDGTVVGWGYSSFGAVNVPEGLSNIVAIAAGGGHSMALKTDGTVSAWGSDLYGPATVPAGLSNVVAIKAGILDFFSLALKADGSLVAWGHPHGPYADFGLTNLPTGLSNVLGCAAGFYHAMALTSDNTLAPWGAGMSTASPEDHINYGQSIIPSSLSNVVAMDAQYFHSLALKSDGTVEAWGAGTNVVGGTSLNKGQSIVPAGLSNVVAVASGGTFSLAMVGSGPPTSLVALTNYSKTANGFAVTMPAECGRVYRLEYKAALADSTWTGLPLVAGNGAMLTLTNSPTPDLQGFYRVRRW